MSIVTKRLTDINDFTQDRNGKPLTTKDGRPYTRRVIKLEGSNEQISGFKGKENFIIGDEVTVEISETDYNGRKYYNWKLPSNETRMMEEIMGLKRRVSALEAMNTDKVYPVRDETTTPDFEIEQPMGDINDLPIPW